MSQNKDGKGASKHTTAEEQNLLRRAAKGRPKKNTPRTRPALTEGLAADRQAREEAAAKRREEREEARQRLIAFREEQVNVARNILQLQDLFGLAERFSELMLKHFPTVYVPKGTGRTHAARAKAAEELTKPERARHAVIALAAGRTKTALTEAFEELEGRRVAAQPTPDTTPVTAATATALVVAAA